MWNLRGIAAATPHHPKKRLIYLMNTSIILLNEQWYEYKLRDYKSNFIRDVSTASSKINVSCYLKDTIAHNLTVHPEANTIIMTLPDINIDVITVYFRPENCSTNDNLYTTVTDHISESSKSTLIYGDFNRDQELPLFLQVMGFSESEIGDTFLRTKNQQTTSGCLQRIFQKGLVISHEVVQESA